LSDLPEFKDPAPLAGNAEPAADVDRERIVSEEETCLGRVLDHLTQRRSEEPGRAAIDYDAELVSLRDQIASARAEDVPPLLEQMERLQALASRRQESSESQVDPQSPYFGRMVLEEEGRRREVLIGRGTHLDTKSGIRIVDWRDAPVSRLYYRYGEGEEYDEVFGDREVNGRVTVRRSVTIAERELRRINAPQGMFVRSRQRGWVRLDDSATRLHGGQGSAIRAEQTTRSLGKLGVGDALTDTDDKHLKEITPLIDRRQFELITRPDSGLVVIQGGAGSGKTTIGLHRLAYLAFQDKRRFRPDKMLVVVFNHALARYISQVLPSLGLEGVAIRTYADWAARLRATHLPLLPRRYSDDTPTVVTRLKKHPAMLRLVDERVKATADLTERALEELVAKDGAAEPALRAWQATATRPFAHRVASLQSWLDSTGQSLPPAPRHALAREVDRAHARSQDVVSLWADLLTDRALLTEGFARLAPGQFTPAELDRAHTWCVRQVTRAVTEAEERQEAQAEAQEREGGREARARREGKPDRERRRSEGEGGTGRASSKDRARPKEEPGEAVIDGEELAPKRKSAEDDVVDPVELAFNEGIDGRELDEAATLDVEDDTLLLRILQRLRGALRKGQVNKEPLVYEHVLVDEAQDLSPVELAVILDTLSRGQSVTLAGDTAQRLHMDNGFSDWKTVLGELGLEHVEVEPLKLSYRSTREILELSQAVLGPLAPADPPEATRGGAPVELFQMAQTGDAVAHLSEALRELMHSEPRASVAVIARFPEQADLYYEGLRKGEVPYLRRITDQEFPFRPGVDVTDIRQVKGLEFDYVILVEVSESSYPEEDESRHLLHIGATRAAHQLWVLCAGKPSRLLPEALRDRGY
jgi:DNA helicase-2/ATP-dependent DNA helicase PcrA